MSACSDVPPCARAVLGSARPKLLTEPYCRASPQRLGLLGWAHIRGRGCVALHLLHIMDGDVKVLSGRPTCVHHYRRRPPLFCSSRSRSDSPSRKGYQTLCCCRRSCPPISIDLWTLLIQSTPAPHLPSSGGEPLLPSSGAQPAETADFHTSFLLVSSSPFLWKAHSIGPLKASRTGDRAGRQQGLQSCSMWIGRSAAQWRYSRRALSHSSRWSQGSAGQRLEVVLFSERRTR